MCKKSNFEILLCVGSFFNGSSAGNIEDYKTGKKKVPIPTYILGPNSDEQQQLYDFLNITDESNEICENLHYLGRKGVFTLAAGFSVAYMSGIECPKDGNKESWQFDKKDIIAVRNSCLKNFTNMDDYRGIDFLLTSAWPTGINEETSSKLISFLALGAKPRYHFCGINNQHFEKPPFRFPSQGGRSIDSVSRFIALAKQNNTTKSKFLYALNVAPVSVMRLTDLVQRSTDEIECPYIKIDFSEFGANTNENVQFFWNCEDGGDKKRSKNNDGQRKKFKQMTDTEKCWFCLSSPDVEKHLIVTVGENFYIALAKGPVNNHHVLILPVEHIQSAAQLSEDHFQELELFKRSLKKFFESLNKVAVFFERNYKAFHMQVNAIPIDRDLEWQIKETFTEKAEEFGLTFETIPKLMSSNDLPERSPYFVIELPNNETHITRQMNRFPLNFGREIVCAETLLNSEDKIDWRQCSLSKNIEEDLIRTFREGYKEFDFTQDE